MKEGINGAFRSYSSVAGGFVEDSDVEARDPISTKERCNSPRETGSLNTGLAKFLVVPS